jgi:hypothetical protein
MSKTVCNERTYEEMILSSSFLICAIRIKKSWNIYISLLNIY